MSNRTYCYNTQQNALTTWHLYAFSRIWRMGGKYYGVREDGIYELTGDTDNGTTIQAYALLAPNNLGSDRQKRLPYLTIDCTAEGTVKVLSDTSDTQSTTQFTHDRRAKLGRGLAARYLTIELSSDEADFEVSRITLYPEEKQKGVR